MQRSVHSLHATERMSVVHADGSSTTQTYTADCATTPASLLAAVHMTSSSTGPQSGIVQAGRGQTSWGPNWFVDGIQESVVRWKSGGQPTAWFRTLVGRDAPRIWQKQTGGMGNVFATQAGFLCPSSRLFRNPCVSGACPSQPGPIIPENLTNWGTAVLQGTKVWVLESSTTRTGNGWTVAVATDFYVARSSLRLLRYVRSEFDTVAKPATGQDHSSLDVFDYSAFNKPVTIKIPRIRS
jgi:hypothetical protein